MISIVSSTHREGKCWTGSESTETYLQELHLGEGLQSSITKNPEIRSSTSPDTYSFLPATRM
jgi:hypothetical protein